MLATLLAAALAASPRADTVTRHGVTFPVDSVVLAGTLHLPPGDGPVPGVMLLHSARGDTRSTPRIRATAEEFVAAGYAGTTRCRKPEGRGSRRSLVRSGSATMERDPRSRFATLGVG